MKKFIRPYDLCRVLSRIELSYIITLDGIITEHREANTVGILVVVDNVSYHKSSDGESFCYSVVPFNKDEYISKVAWYYSNELEFIRPLTDDEAMDIIRREK